MMVTHEMRLDLLWWVSHIALQTRQIFRKGTELDLYTDASNLGWGGHLNQQKVNGRWSLSESALHINAKELKAISLVVRSFASLLNGRHVWVFCDNTTAVTYVNEMGGTRSSLCNDICRDLWRTFNDSHEWKLNEELFRALSEVFGVPSIVLFASRLNAQVTCFCSWKPDPDAEHFDAFSICWYQFELLYLFPPFALIPRCLQKIRAESAKGWMVLPLWPSQPWMGTLLTLLVKEPRLIPRGAHVLRHPLTEEEHPILRHTRLMACLLSGNVCETVAFLRQVRTSSLPPGDLRLRGSTSHILTGGYSFVVAGTSIPLLPL
ncbi:uncharacterized protein [Panulirus ornatus]|uniref:uncharacterized protein n=1 Tax=Panulirus ornatus TaxID=150431 RepID=UPI003A84016E